jgi:hypothetical protein
MSSNAEGDTAIMGNEFPIGIDRVVADDVTRALPIEPQRTSVGTRYDDLLCESHDLAATQGEHALSLARLYLASARKSCALPDTSAELDRARAECLFYWAEEATHKATAAGRCFLNGELALLKAELHAFDLARGACTSNLRESSSTCVLYAEQRPARRRGRLPGRKRISPQTFASASDTPRDARLMRGSR